MNGSLSEAIRSGVVAWNGWRWNGEAWEPACEEPAWIARAAEKFGWAKDERGNWHGTSA